MRARGGGGDAIAGREPQARARQREGLRRPAARVAREVVARHRVGPGPARHARERVRPDAQRAEHDHEGPEVHRRVAGAAPQLLRRHVRQRAHHKLLEEAAARPADRRDDPGVDRRLELGRVEVGEDARAGRIYLPLDWIHAEGLDPQSVLSATQASPELRRMVKKLLSEAQALYARSEVGVAALPLNARTGIYAARYIYAAIGQAVTRNHYDSITHRGRTNRAQKMALLAKSSLRTTASLVMPKSPVLYARPLPEVQFLVDAVAVNQRHAMSWGQGHTGAFMAAMAELKRKDHAQASGVMLAK